jgi:uncharacterized protein with PQ loop repeat
MNCSFIGINTSNSNSIIPYSSTYANAMVVLSVLTSLGGFIQAIHILNQPVHKRARECEGVSQLTWIVASFSNIAWIIYGLMLNDLVIIISSVVGYIGCSVAILVVWYYDSPFESKAAKNSKLNYDAHSTH